MVFGIIIGFVPVLYMYLKYQYMELPEEEKQTYVVVFGTFALFIAEYILLTATTHEYIITALASAILTIVIMNMIISSHNKGLKYVEEHGLDAAVGYEKRKTIITLLFWFVLCVVVYCLWG